MARINPAYLSKTYMVTDAFEDDFEELYRLFCSNREYFGYFSLKSSRDALRRDMTILPDSCAAEQKHFVAYRDADGMAALMDLIEGYPDAKTCYIGLFMVDHARAGQGKGSAIMTELSDALKTLGYEKLRLAYGKDYRHAEHFWAKNGFVPVREAYLEEYGELIVAERVL